MRSDPSQVTWGLVRDWCVSGVKRVQEDLEIEMVRPLLRAQPDMSERWEERMVADWGMLTEVAIAVKSSA